MESLFAELAMHREGYNSLLNDRNDDVLVARTSAVVTRERVKKRERDQNCPKPDVKP
jgi:hypothetical protein